MEVEETEIMDWFVEQDERTDLRDGLREQLQIDQVHSVLGLVVAQTQDQGGDTEAEKSKRSGVVGHGTWTRCATKRCLWTRMR